MAEDRLALFWRVAKSYHLERTKAERCGGDIGHVVLDGNSAYGLSLPKFKTALEGITLNSEAPSSFH